MCLFLIDFASYKDGKLVKWPAVNPSKKSPHFSLLCLQPNFSHPVTTPIDAAVAEAYGWLAGLPEGEILERLVRLNAGRAAEEAAGHIRWLRPAYQSPGAAKSGIQGKLLELGEELPAPEATPPGKRSWPGALPAQAAALRDLLPPLDAPADAAALSAAFEGKPTPKRKADIQRLLETLAALGQAEEVREGWWGRA